ncbi:Proteophosphoglycan 5 [Rhodotorula diobovata]|uniref:Proteophosphoglycan 5 n=1 Tax=Rhodotorula diobovata TaxID=5288 RepID=A0A5C5FT12_9BASI|nr:Proteophosphoglycan 5 [Rhodotorula diobovata]
MGLAGASKKQRIQDDPRNTRWAQDTSAPGFRLLASMGWNPESAPTLGNAQSQAAILANGGSVFSKRIASIPTAKDDTLGIGMKRGSAAAVVGSLKALGVPSATGANAATPLTSGFVTAGSMTPQDGVTGGGSGGGEFGNLLARLNKLKEQNGTLSASASPAPEPSEQHKKKRKRSSSASSSSSAVSSDSSDSDDSDAEPTPSTSTLPAAPSPAPDAVPAPSAAALAILRNPRMAARSKHLRAKRMATASNASAMAEILGLAPTPSASPSPAQSGASTPVLAVNGPRTDGWPAVPERGSSAIAVQRTTTTTTTTESVKGVGAAPVAARRADKAARREAARGADKRSKERSPSPEFRVHSAQHNPFKVSDETPTAAPVAAGLGSVFGRMFVGAASGGMGATFVPPTEEASAAPAPPENAADRPSKKERKAAKEVEGKGDGEGESKEERRARKEAKRAKKAAKLAAKAEA